MGYRCHDRQGELLSGMEMKYDELGRATKIKRGEEWDELVYGENGCPVIIRIEGKYEFQFDYDTCNRMISRTDGNGNTINYSYDPCDRLVSVSYPDESRTSYSYDKSGRITGLVKNTGDEYTFSYDQCGRLAEVNRNRKDKLQICYDAIGNISAVTIADRGTMQFEALKGKAESSSGKKMPPYQEEMVVEEKYDATGNLIYRKLKDGRESQYTYDCMNRLTGIAEEKGCWWHFTYGENGKCIKKTDPLGNHTEFGYDKDGSLISVTDAMGHVFGIIRQRYLLETETGQEAERSRQTANTPDYQTEQLKMLISENVAETRDACGRLTGRSYPCGARSVYSYQKGNRPERIVHMQAIYRQETTCMPHRADTMMPEREDSVPETIGQAERETLRPSTSGFMR